jgi:hypothetical protein
LVTFTDNDDGAASHPDDHHPSRPTVYHVDYHPVSCVDDLDHDQHQHFHHLHLHHHYHQHLDDDHGPFLLGDDCPAARQDLRN